LKINTRRPRNCAATASGSCSTFSPRPRITTGARWRGISVPIDFGARPLAASAAIVAAAAITALAVFSYFAEGDSMVEGHARTRTQIINTVRWVIVITLSWMLIPTALAEPSAQRAEAVVGLAALIGATILIPVKWFVRIGGLEPTWELRRTKIEVALLANRVRRGTGNISPSRLRETVDRIALIKTPETAEMCDLLTAQLEDLIAGREPWNEAGRRSIRIDELGRELWPTDMLAPDFASEEATFRWHLYRHFGRMMELGTGNRPTARCASSAD